MKPKSHILPTIILAQLACTSLWFAGNAIVDELALKTGLGPEIIAYLLSAVQLGFISGTLAFALLMIVDRFPPSRVFVICAILAAICNLFLLSQEISKLGLLSARFGTGFFLAGIYPVGMKIAADYYEKGLGKALGFLVGALVFGTALPYLVFGSHLASSPENTIKIVSALSVLGGFSLWLFVPNGPFRKPSLQLQLQTCPALFRISAFRKAAFGYFGHMWELYAFWAFTPIAIKYYNNVNNSELSVLIWTGCIIALGGCSCILGGLISQKIGSYKVAFSALLLSGMLCLLSPLLFQLPSVLFLIGWCIWGMAVTADSPQFSNMVAGALPPELKGTGLTLVNCLGFAITIVSIQLLSNLMDKVAIPYLFIVLAIGPISGLIALMQRPS